MNLFESIVIGIVQGLTEFIPVSSTAHVRILPALLGWDDPGAAVTAVTQLGTLAAVLVFFRNDILRLTHATYMSIFRWSGRHAWDDRQKLDVRLAWFIALGTAPIGGFGLLLKEVIERELRSLWIIAAALIGLALVLGLAEWVSVRRKEIRDIGLAETQAVGWAQALALIPGVSRSGVTITAGLLAGMTREASARFSFLLSIPAILASGLFELKDLLERGLGEEGLVNLAIATLVAGVVGYASIAFLLRWLQTRSTWVFIGYRIVLGLLILALTYAGIIR